MGVLSVRIIAALLALVFASPAFAQSAGLPYTYPVTVGVTGIGAIGPNNARKRIEFYNSSDANKIAVCPTISRTSVPAITCAVNGAGSITLLPYQSYRIDGVGGNPQVNSAWNAIASGGGSSLTIFEWE
jgi:hypothetical protein